MNLSKRRGHSLNYTIFCAASQSTYSLPCAAMFEVEHLLQNVQVVKAANTAFAAILSDSQVVTWGEARHQNGASVCWKGNIRANWAELARNDVLLVEGSLEV